MKPVNCSICGKVLATEDAESAICRACTREESRPPVSSGDGLQAPVYASTLLAIASGGLFYGLGPFLLLRDTYADHLFCGHGWVPYVCVFLFFSALWTMLLKLPLLRRQYSAFGLNLLPRELDVRIDQLDANRILARISRLTRKQRSLLLVVRVRQALLRLNQLGTAEKLDDALRYRAEADEAAMDSSYAGPKFIIWAIPVLGFVGTVLGISNGVSAFSTLIQNASDLDGLRESLKGVTYGLGQAFETTMIALCMSLGLMLVMSWLQRREDRLLAQIDDYCMENLLHKVDIAAPGPPAGRELAEVIKSLRELTAQLRGGEVAAHGGQRSNTVAASAPKAIL